MPFISLHNVKKGCSKYSRNDPEAPKQPRKAYHFFMECETVIWKAREINRLIDDPFFVSTDPKEINKKLTDEFRKLKQSDERYKKYTDMAETVDGPYQRKLKEYLKNGWYFRDDGSKSNEPEVAIASENVQTNPPNEEEKTEM